LKVKKALYKHKKSGELFAIETDEKGNIISTSGPLLKHPKLFQVSITLAIYGFHFRKTFSGY